LPKLRTIMSTITQNNQGDYKIEKLNGSNYSIWSINFLNYFNKEWFNTINCCHGTWYLYHKSKGMDLKDN